MNGYERHYIKLVHKGQMKGLALFNVDHSAFNEFRGYIRHVSTTEFSHFDKALE